MGVTNRLFGLDIAKIVNDSIASAGGVLDITLQSVTPGAGTDADPNSLTPTSTSHSAKGFIDDYDDNKIDGTIIRKGDREVVILGDSITPSVAPKTNDKVIAEDDTYNVERVNRDPAGATYTLQVR